MLNKRNENLEGKQWVSRCEASRQGVMISNKKWGTRFGVSKQQVTGGGCKQVVTLENNRGLTLNIQS